MKVTIEVPSVPYPGASTDQEFFRHAARALRDERLTGTDIRHVSGSNLRATIAALLDRVSDALDEATASPYRAGDVYELTRTSGYDEGRQVRLDAREPGPGGKWSATTVAFPRSPGRVGASTKLSEKTLRTCWRKVAETEA